MKQWRATCRPIGGEATILPRVYDPPLGGASRGRSARFLDRRAPCTVDSPVWTDPREKRPGEPFYGALIPFGRDHFFFFLSPPLSFCSLNEPHRLGNTVRFEKNSIPPGDSLLLASVVFAESIFRGISIFLEFTSSEVKSWYPCNPSFLLPLSLDIFLKFF